MAAALDLVRLTRPANALVSAAGAYVGALLGYASWTPTLAVGAAMVAALAFAAAGNVRNDLSDITIDRRAHPERPLARGAVSVPAARALAIGLYLLAVAAGALVSWLGLALVVAAIPVMEGYERHAKARGLPGNLLVALLTGAPFVLGGIAAGDLNGAVLAVAALAALATAGREILKDAEDVDADRGHRRTYPMRVGARAAGIAAAGFLLAAIVLSPLPLLLETVLGAAYLPAVGAADLCFLAAAAAGPRAPGRGQRLAKIGMVAALIALVLGRATG